MTIFGANPWIVGGILLLIFILITIKNIGSGAFSLAKFFGGFNLFAGGVQGKLMYYGIIALVAGILAYGLYHQLTRATYDTDYKNTYKNTITGNENVTVDQKQVINSDISCFGFSLGQTCIGVAHSSIPKVSNTITNKSDKKVVIDKTNKSVEYPVVKKEVKKETIVKKAKSTIFKKVWRVISFHINIIKKAI